MSRWLGLGSVGDRTSKVAVQLPDGKDTVVEVEVISVDNRDESTFRPEKPEFEPDVGLTVGTKSSLTTKSKPSNIAPYSTLYNSFKFEVKPTFNFYVEDETTNEYDKVSDRDIKDIPRYIKLSWKKAPITLDASSRSNNKRLPATKLIRSDSTVVRNVSSGGIIRSGMTFKPSAVDFKTAKDSVVNGYISPGSISTVVEMPITSNNNLISSRKKIDEMTFLTSELTDGISINDLQNAIDNVVNDDERITTIESNVKSISPDEKELLFDNRYEIRFNPFDTGKIEIKALAASSPILSMEISTQDFKTSDQLINIVKEITPVNADVEEDISFTEVIFTDLNIDGIISEEKIPQMNSPEHVENTVALGKMLPGFAAFDLVSSDMKLTKEIPSFPAAREDAGTEYIGYVIEKYKMGNDGVFDLVDEINIKDVNTVEYIDTRVLYGTTYRYRIKSILRWTRPRGVTHIGTDNSFLSFDGFSSTDLLLNYGSSFFQSEWNRKWKYSAVIDVIPPPPPDEFTVRSESHKKSVVITWKLPDNHQRDISCYRLFRKQINIEGKELTDWELIHVVPGAVNVLFVDQDVSYYQNNGGKMYIYAAQCVSLHGEYSKLSTQLAVKLNSEHKIYGEFPTMHISCAGVGLYDVGSFSVRPIRRFFSRIVAKDTISMVGRNSSSKIMHDDMKYCIRIQSLDTGEERDFILTIDYENLAIRYVLHNKTIIIHANPDNKLFGQINTGPSIVVGNQGIGINTSQQEPLTFIPADLTTILNTSK